MRKTLSSADLLSDLDFFHDKLPALHINAFHTTSQAIFNSQIEKLQALINSQPIDTYTFALELQKIVALLKESHTRVRVNKASDSDKYTPVLFQWLQDGYYVMAIEKELAKHIGNKLIGIGKASIDQVTSRLKPFISSENVLDYTIDIPPMLTSLEPLKSLKLVPKGAAEIMYQMKDTKGKEHSIKMKAFPYKDRPNMSSRSHSFVHNPFFRSRCPYCVESRIEDKALIIHYSSCHDYEENPLSKYKQDITKAIRKENPKKVVIDLRNNPGGDSALFNPIIKVLKVYKKNNPSTEFSILVNENVFSSGIINAYETRDALKARVFGTTPRQKPNHFGEVQELKLPKSKIVVQYSTKFFRYTKDDAEKFIPDETIELSIQDYLNGTDAVIEAALR